MSFQKYFLYINTLKYLKRSQFYHRGLFVFKKKVLYKSERWKKGNKEKNINLIKSIKEIRPLIFDITKIDTNFNIESIKKNVEMLHNKEFIFLNKRVVFDKELGWEDPNLSQLWRYNLHYFDYFRSLVEMEFINPDKRNYRLLKYYIGSWVTNNEKIGLGDGWHSYTISLRLINWIYAYSAFYEYLKKDPEFNNYFLNSIVIQSQFLLKNREYDVVGNHLFENLKTLIITGLFLGENEIGKECLAIGEKEMSNQLYEQFLFDGGHFELSAMYHNILLKGLTELIYVYNNLKNEIPYNFLETQQKALNYLINIIHPDGEIPLFNDAAFGIADTPTYIIEYVLKSEKTTSSLSLFDQVLSATNAAPLQKDVNVKSNVFYAKQSGYLKTSDETLFSIIDIGKPCPDYLPAHAHADIFSYELSLNNNRIVVDTGTYEYSGKKRDYDRSTKAHNTLTINKENQSEVWGNFRVARRAKPTIISFEENNNFVQIFASHDGYSKKFKTLHYRKYIHIFNQAIIVMDYVNSTEKIESYIHLAPSSAFSLDGKNIVFKNEDLMIKPINSNFIIEDSIYHPKFGVEETIKKVVVQPRTSGVFGYYYTLGNNNINQNEKRITIDTGEEILNFDLDWGSTE